MSHPFGILYLLCAILLNYLGSMSIKSLSRILAVLIIMEYGLLVTNYTNKNMYGNVPQELKEFQQQSLIKQWFDIPEQW